MDKRVVYFLLITGKLVMRKFPLDDLSIPRCRSIAKDMESPVFIVPAPLNATKSVWSIFSTFSDAVRPVKQFVSETVDAAHMFALTVRQ